jgi:hypothetical protein
MNSAKILRFTEKHALIVVSRNEFDTTGTIGYVKKAQSITNLQVGDTFLLPEGWSITQKYDEHGDVLCTKGENPEPLSFFTWK